jgi:hypothetical protein
MNAFAREQMDEQTVAELRELLVSPEPVPPGLIQRMEAYLAREVRRWASTSPGEVLMFICIAFVAVLFGSKGQLGMWSVLIGIFAAVAYGYGIRWLLGEAAASEDPDGSAVGGGV